jgi:hypothetical protein
MARGDRAPARKTGSVTRPDNTTQYAINDAISDSTSSPSAIEIANAARGGGYGGEILGATVLCSANQGTLPELELYLFQEEPTATNDNAEFGLTDADAANLVARFVLDGFYDLDVTTGADGNAADDAAPDGAFEHVFRCPSGATSLYALLKVTNAYTPVAQEVFTVILHIRQA